MLLPEVVLFLILAIMQCVIPPAHLKISSPHVILPCNMMQIFNNFSNHYKNLIAGSSQVFASLGMHYFTSCLFSVTEVVSHIVKSQNFFLLERGILLLIYSLVTLR